MRDRWKEKTLSSITIKITKGTTPTTVGGNFTESGINFIKSESITEGRKLDVSKYTFIDEETHDKLKRSQIEANDILFSIAGVYLGKTGIVSESDIPANTNQAVAIIRIDSQKADYEYIYYWLNNKAVLSYVNNSVSQSAQPNFNLKQVGDISVWCPSILQQRAISATLSCLDDKIELNNKISANLEAQAQTLFKHWFVDFEFPNEEGLPYKSSGGEMVESKLEPIPKGWRVGSLQDIAQYASERIRTEFCSKDNYISTDNMQANKQGVTFANTIPTSSSVSRYGENDILISNIRPYFKKIWFADKVGGCSNDVLVIRAIHKELSGLLYTILYNDAFFDYSTVTAKGTKMPRGDKSAIMKYAIVMPNLIEKNNCAKKFSELALHFKKRISALHKENHTLATLRDALLPRLMSGEITVPIDEEAVSERS